MLKNTRNVISVLALSGCAATLAPSVDANGNYQVQKCEGENLVTELWDGKGTRSPFDDIKIDVAIILENGCPDTRGGNDDRNNNVGNVGGSSKPDKGPSAPDKGPSAPDKGPDTSTGTE